MRYWYVAVLHAHCTICEMRNWSLCLWTQKRKTLRERRLNPSVIWWDVRTIELALSWKAGPTRRLLPSLAVGGGPAGMICTVMEGLYCLPPCRTVPSALSGAAKLLAGDISSFWYMLNVKTNRHDWNHTWQAETRARILKLLRSPGIDSKASIPPAM